jgi:hypothetical protein
VAAVGYVWAFSALTASPGARTYYDRRKTTGDCHTAAQRNLFNRLLGWLSPRQARGLAVVTNLPLPRRPERRAMVLACLRRCTTHGFAIRRP